MEEQSKSEEPFLKIERTWSEAEQNFENITVKEEDISDVEPETLLQELEDNNYKYIIPNDKTEKQSDEGLSNNLEEDALARTDSDNNKKGKSKGNASDLNPNCLHDAKNFKVIKKRLRCSDCKAILCPECYCTINSSLQTHFSKSDNNNKKLYPCKLCSMIFKANCALQAHIRIHLLDTPYVCPDCGAMYNNIYFLSLHLINKCYHVYKVVSNGCKFCLSQNMSPEDYISHIEKSHIKPVCKCSKCGLIFENVTDINRHMGSVHKNENVMSLRYYSCSICGNLKISKQLYAKHIKYHRDHSAEFQIGYLCSCGHSFNTACSFRTHFKNCSKKGILPPQWTYLQVTLKTHEMLQVHSAIEKSTFLQSESGFMNNPLEIKNGSEKKQLDLSLFEDGDSSEEFEEPGEGSHANGSNDSEFGKTKSESRRKMQLDGENGVESNGSKESENNQGEICENGEEKSEVICKHSCQDVAEITTELLSGREEESVPNVQIDQEVQDGNIITVNPEQERGSDNDDRTLKVIYDHIPCDHLGYLKTQQSSELQDKNLKKNDNESVKSCEFSDIPVVADNYVISSVLDEKTGLMRKRKLFLEKTQTEQVEEDRLCDLEILDNQNCDLQKSRSGTFFSCPFCSVLFPKHFSSFHRFRLHLECYHPEAALDITVDRTQIPKSQTPFSSIKIQENDLDWDGDGNDLDNVDLQTRLNSLREENSVEDFGNVTLQTSESSNDGNESNLQSEFSIRERKKKGLSQARRTERNAFNLKLRHDKRAELRNEEEVTVKPIIKENKKNSFSRKINENFRIALKQNVDLLRIDDFAEEGCERKEHETSGMSVGDEENSESMDSEIGSGYNGTTKVKHVCDNGLEEGAIKEENIVKKISAKNARVSEDSLSDDKGTNDFHYFDKQKEHDKKQDGGKRGQQNIRDGEEFERSDCGKEEKTGKSSERRDSRRESDVWSEFYKTLKIAETLKKTKAKNQQNEDAPILSNYTNKRIVKKPKRYRESSDSDESNEGESSKFDPEDEDFYEKKKKLMSRLENVDYRILDYVFKILERKQKNSGFIRGKDLNKKLINGAKLMGKQSKTNHEMEEGEEEKEILNLNGEELNWDHQIVTTIEDKGDKKRGRPRKTDLLALKERRRSDYDDKNLEGEEDDMYGRKKKRKLSNKLQYYKKMLENKDFSSGQVISTTKNSDQEKKLTCAVCKESHQTESEFREHIQTHRMDESSHQCMECGECFVVRPSLEKHLHAFHKIKDVQKYIKENDCSTPDKSEEVENEPLKENQCKVCKDQFLTIHELNKHFRIHGMAFLRQFKKDAKSNQ